jgi:hypothetical protein
LAVTLKNPHKQAWLALVIAPMLSTISQLLTWNCAVLDIAPMVTLQFLVEPVIEMVVPVMVLFCGPWIVMFWELGWLRKE